MISTSKPATRPRFWALLIPGVVLIATAIVMVRANKPAPTDAGSLTPSATSRSTTSAAGSISPQAVAPAAAPSADAPTSTAWSTTGAVTTTGRGGNSNHLDRTSPPPPQREAAPATSTSAPAQLGRPAVLHLPTLKVTADIRPVDSTDGVLQVPEDITAVGWWQHSAPSGSAVGSTVLDGHIDSAAAGEGALFHLADLSPGDPLTVTNTTGATITYRVQARRVYVKAQGLPATLFDQNVPARLVIISCGGSFDPTIGSYRDNIAIFATPTI